MSEIRVPFLFIFKTFDIHSMIFKIHDDMVGIHSVTLNQTIQLKIQFSIPIFVNLTPFKGKRYTDLAPNHVNQKLRRVRVSREIV